MESDCMKVCKLISNWFGTKKSIWLLVKLGSNLISWSNAISSQLGLLDCKDDQTDFCEDEIENFALGEVK